MLFCCFRPSFEHKMTYIRQYDALFLLKNDKKTVKLSWYIICILK